MKNKLQLSLFSHISLVVVTIIVSIFIVSNHKSHSLNPEYMKLLDSQVVLSPIKYKREINLSPAYPNVLHKPGSLMYSLALLKEDLSIKLGHESHSFYAKKRIAEITSFSPELSNVNDLQITYQNDLTKFLHKNSTDYLLNSYATHTQALFLDAHSSQDALKLLNDLISDQTYLTKIANENKLSNYYKEFFNLLIKDLFSELHLLSESSYIYSLDSVKNYGQLKNYEVSLPADIAEETRNLFILTNDSIQSFDSSQSKKIPDKATYIIKTFRTDESESGTINLLRLVSFNNDAKYDLYSNLLYSEIVVNNINSTQLNALKNSFRPFSHFIAISENRFIILPISLFLIPTYFTFYIIWRFRNIVLIQKNKYLSYFRNLFRLMRKVYFLFDIYHVYFSVMKLMLFCYVVAYILSLRIIAEIFMQLFVLVLFITFLLYLLRPLITRLNTSNEK